MAKMTMGKVVYEGTPEELRAILGVNEVTATEPEYKTVNRNAVLGDRILITDASHIQKGDPYRNGMVLKVTDYNTAFPICGNHGAVLHREYEVITK